MNRMIDSKADNKNVEFLKTLWELRQTLDVYCLIVANGDYISRKGLGKNFFGFLRNACVHLITIDICKIFENEKKSKRNKIKYELNSIDGVLSSLSDANAPVLNSTKVNSFVRKYSNGHPEEGTLLTLSSVIEGFKAKYQEELERVKTFRDKRGVHSESEFNPCDLPSYDIMERLFNFGLDFYMLVSEAIISVIPTDLNKDRRTKASLKKILLNLGFEEIKTEME